MEDLASEDIVMLYGNEFRALRGNLQWRLSMENQGIGNKHVHGTFCKDYALRRKHMK